MYSIIVPNNSAAILDQGLLDSLGGTDQAQAIDYFNSLYSLNVRTVPILDALRQHRSEYTYFRTDHHWTALGAYVAYQEFCKAKALEPVELSSLKTMTFDGFLGSFYTELKNPAMADNPDTVTAYIPKGSNDMTYWDGATRQMARLSPTWKVGTRIRCTTLSSLAMSLFPSSRTPPSPTALRSW